MGPAITLGEADYKERDRTGKEQGSGSPPIELQQGSGFSSSSKGTGKTKRKTTGFFLYTKDIQAELEFVAGAAKWRQLSPEEREGYKAMAKSQRNPSLASPIIMGEKGHG